MINDMKPGEVRTLVDGTPIQFVTVPNISSLDNPCYGCAFEYEPCADRRILLGACDGLDREDGQFGIFIKMKKDG